MYSNQVIKHKQGHIKGHMDGTCMMHGTIHGRMASHACTLKLLPCTYMFMSRFTLIITHILAGVSDSK